MRTRLGVCRRKARFATEAEARDAAARTGLVVHAYRCDRGAHYHLTSRTKGRRVPRPEASPKA